MFSRFESTCLYLLGYALKVARPDGIDDGTTDTFPSWMIYLVYQVAKGAMGALTFVSEGLRDVGVFTIFRIAAQSMEDVFHVVKVFAQGIKPSYNATQRKMSNLSK